MPALLKLFCTRPYILLFSALLVTAPLSAQTAVGPGSKDAGQSNNGAAGATDQGGDSKDANADNTPSNRASGKTTTVSAIAPSVAPPNTTGRRRIGVALGGGAALAMSEIGAIQWMEEHHIPVDVVAGTSMGCMIAALYSTGKTPDQLKTVMNDSVFSSVFSLSDPYQSRSFRRRQDSQELPNGVTIGLKHGVSFRNSVLIDQGLNAFLDRQFLRWDDKTDFNRLPIPLRCVATDLNDAEPAVFARGSLPDAVRASVSLPGIYQPFAMNGHEYVDGGVLENLPTHPVQEMKPDVIIAVSLPLTPVQKGDLNSILGVLERSASVFIESREREDRKLANVVISPDVEGFSGSDYLKAPELALRGYMAAYRQRDQLLQYAISDREWQDYMAERRAKLRPEAGPILRVRVQAPHQDVTRAVQELFAPLVNQPVDTKRIEALLDDVRADGRYQADYTVGYETASQFVAQTEKRAPTPSDTAASSSAAETPEELAQVPVRPIILVTVSDKKTGPPFLIGGLNVEAQTTAVTRATVEGILLDQDLGGYGSELRSTIKLGYLTDLNVEYFHPIHFYAGTRKALYVQPEAEELREPFSIYTNQRRIADRQLQRISVGSQVGWTNRRTIDLQAGYSFEHVDWTTLIGNDNSPDMMGNAQRARLKYTYDTQDRALVPHFGVRFIGEADYLFNAVNSQNTPQITGQFSYARTRRDAHGDPTSNALFFYAEGGSMLHRDVSQPFRFTLGGPQRLSASAIDEYRGTDFFLIEPAILHRIASLPAPLGQSIYLGLSYEAGQMYAPNTSVITQQDVYFGVVAETPLGIITIAPAIGTDGHRKLVFTLGKLF